MGKKETTARQWGGRGEPVKTPYRDLRPPLASPWGVLRKVEFALGDGSSRVLYLRSLPAGFGRSPKELDRFQGRLARLSELSGGEGSALGDVLSRWGGVLRASALEDPRLPASHGPPPSLYLEILEPDAEPLDEFLKNLFQSVLPRQAAAALSQGPASGAAAAEESKLIRWLELRWRIQCGVEIVTRILRGLDEYHRAGGFHGALTPDAVMVIGAPRAPLPPEFKNALWKGRLASCMEIAPRPRLIDVELFAHLLAGMDHTLSGFGLSFKEGRIQGELGRLQPEQIEQALSVAAHPLRLHSPPEVTRSGKAESGPSSDLYFCGVLLYRILTDVHPYAERTAYATLTRMLAADHPSTPVVNLNPEVPEPLARAVHRAIDPDPSRRFPDARAFAAALSDLEFNAPEVFRRV